MKEFLVTRFMSGDGEMPRRTRWWPCHSKDLTRFLLLLGAPDRKAAAAARKLILSEGLDWDEIMTGLRKEGPMSEHAHLEIELVEAAMKTDLVKIKRIGDYLRRNVLTLSDAICLKVEDIPRERLVTLLAAHAASFVESVMRYMDGKEKEYLECERRRSENTVALATFSTEWI